MIFSFEGGGSASHYMGASFWRRLWTCRQTEYGMNDEWETQKIVVTATKNHLRGYFHYLTIKVLYNRCTGMYKFGNNTYPPRIRRMSNLGHFFGKKCVLWAGKYGIYTYIYIFMISRSVLLRMRNVSNKSFK